MSYERPPRYMALAPRMLQLAGRLAVRESTGTPEEAERTRAFLRGLLDD